ncbi:MAG: ribbon-helix-helix protein, CopG family [Zestosphaera sp.]
MTKERFGVSVPADLSRKVKELASRRGVSRSELITEMMRSYITDLEHENLPHYCTGVMVIVKEKAEISLERVYEAFKEVIIGYTHQHVGGMCVNVVFVSGSSERIDDLSKSLNMCGCFIRYLPLHGGRRR